MLNWIRNRINKFLFSYEFEILLMDKDAKVPLRAYKYDAGYDLYVSRTTEIKAGEMVNVPTGVAIKSKRPVWFLLIGRSSTLLKHQLIVDIAVIDHEYTGELYAKVLNVGKETKVLSPNMRVAQIVPMHHSYGIFKKVAEFTGDTVRGDKGFGSSGV